MNALIPNWGTFIGLTLVLGGAGAIAAGRAVANRWRALAVALLSMLALAGATRFLHYALFEEPTDPANYLMDYVLLCGFAAIGYRWRRSALMAQQYPWL